MGFLENDAARVLIINRYMTPRGQVWKWAFWEMGFWGNRFFGKMDAARGLMINRFVTPKGQD
jgi:hypothetical protein